MSGQSTDLIVDANGYFANTPGSLLFYPIAPCRVSDTRAGQGRVGPFGPPALAAMRTVISRFETSAVYRRTPRRTC